MPRSLRNVTVTLDPETVGWARVEAARRNTSVSRMLGEILRREMEGGSAYGTAMERFLAKPSGTSRRPDLSSRDELHDRAGLR